MKTINSIQLFEIDEPVIFPTGWPALAAGQSRFGFKLANRDGNKVWTEATETDLRETLTRYGYTESQIDEAINKRKSADLYLSGCNWNGTACVNQCDRPTHCRGILDIENMFHTCWCEV